MRAAWATDVHLEFLDAPGFERFVEAVRAIGPEALLLTGDIAQATTLGEWLRKVRAAVGVPVLFVLGNHDFYRGSIAEVKAWAATFHQSDEGLRWLPRRGPGGRPTGPSWWAWTAVSTAAPERPSDPRCCSTTGR